MVKFNPATSRKSIEGEVVFMRSKDRPGEKPCMCCGGGPHIFGRYVKIEPQPSIYKGLMMDSVGGFLDEALHTIPGIEGRRVRITIEVLPTREELQEMRDDEYFDEEYD